MWTGDREQHINADIAYAICQYWHWSGDDAFMRDHGAEVVLDTARFWTSRAEHDAAADRYELHNQIGPDEYHENVSNSVFVNRMVVWHLEAALRVFDWLHTRYPDKAADLEARLALTPAERALWRDIAAKMVIPFDAEQGIHIQFDGFFDLEYVDVPAYTPRVTSLQSIYGVERTNQTQVIKQADVVMLMALLGDALAPHDVRLRNWAAYAPRCDHGSSLSTATHAWVAARLGLLDAAYAYFERAAGTDLEDNKGQHRARNSRRGVRRAVAGGRARLCGAAPGCGREPGGGPGAASAVVVCALPVLPPGPAVRVDRTAGRGCADLRDVGAP
ncbi:MAG: hypothetical protein M5R40_21250 [Anaerolineae bacterium]|nr:hypothetical protein [Anaerolineae bacterium]